jgi:hypothetical protein
MTDEELSRFEFFVRSHFSRKKVKAIMTAFLSKQMEGKDITEEMAIAVGGLSKLFVGEVCDIGEWLTDGLLYLPTDYNAMLCAFPAVEVMKDWGEEALGITPNHIQ